MTTNILILIIMTFICGLGMGAILTTFGLAAWAHSDRYDAECDDDKNF